MRIAPLLLLAFCYQTLANSQNDLQTILIRKNQDTVETAKPLFKSIPDWNKKFTTEGKWSDLDYTTGCPARRANWPAQQHFQRIVVMASSWYTDPSKSVLLPNISLAMNYWFGNNYKSADCVDRGGVDGSSCPCSTPGFWNTNWFDQMILMPRIIGNACLLLKSNLTATQATNCSTVAKRAFDRIDTSIYSIGNMTGSNMLDVSSIGMTLAILKGNATIMTDALKHFYGEIAVTSNISADGIKPDGSFLQHGAQLYTGNYGKDFINSVLRIFIQTAGTSMTPSAPVQAAFKTLMEGTEWMILSNSTNHALLWQYSTIGRMVSFRTTDKQASGGVAINLTQITDATSTWKDKQVYQDIVQRLEKPADSANQGPLVGTRHFYRSDYMVHRGTNYIITLKMFSTRTSNSECNNNQNPFGFHLSDGSIFTYRYGDEYTDVFGAWDWNLVPGATVDYGATPLNCNHTQFFGNESFVGGVALNNTGIAVMNYTNPYTGSLSWQKTVIFFPNAYGVQISSARSKNDSAPIITTLDQRRQNTNVTIDGQEGIHEQYDKSLSDGKQHTLWSGDIGYTFPPVASTSEITLKTTMMNLKSNWSAIGISTGDERVPMYTATVQHGQKFEYYVQPALDKEAFVKKTNDSITFVRCEDPVVRGAYSPRDSALGLAFWTPGKFRRSFLTHDASKEEFEIAVETDHPIVLMFQQTSVWWDLAVADPSQLLKTVRLTITFEEKKPIKLDIKLPQGPLAGSSVIRKLKPCS